AGVAMAARAGAVLRRLLAHSDPRIRIMAYESIRQIDPDSVETRLSGREPENFLLEVVPCEGPLLIYARRSGTRRIALIGGDELMMRPPILYAESDKPILISAGPEDKLISVIKKDYRGRKVVGPLRMIPSVPH